MGTSKPFIQKEINDRRKKEKQRDYENMIKEQERLMDLAIEREKAKAEAPQKEEL